MRIPFWILAAVFLASRVCAKDGFDVPLYDPATHRDILPSGEATATPTATLPPAITATPGPSPASPPSALKTPAIPAAPQWAQVKTVPKDVLVNPKLSPGCLHWESEWAFPPAPSFQRPMVWDSTFN